MVIAYPLILEGVHFRHHGIIGIYQIKEKIAVLHDAFGSAPEEQPADDKRKPNYIMLDMFSRILRNIAKLIYVIIRKNSFLPRMLCCMKMVEDLY